MRSPSLLFFLVGIAGALSGLFKEISISLGVTTLVVVVPLFLLIKSRWIRAVLVCVGILIFMAMLSSLQKRQFDATLNTLSHKSLVYEGVLLELSDSLNGDKIGLLQIHSISEVSSAPIEAFVVSLKLMGAASAKTLGAGDTIRLRGKLSKASHALSPGQMDGYWFGLSRNVMGRMSVSEAHDIAVMDRSKDVSVIARLKEKLRKEIVEHLSPREAGLILALIIGDVKLFDDEQQQYYRNIGAGHLLAVSGMQVTMVSLLCYRILLFFFLLIPWVSRRSLAKTPAIALTLLFVWSFVALCGYPPSALRAGLMTSLALGASLYAWPTTSLDIFGASGLIVLLLNPCVVVDPSFWLSYAAVFGLIVAAQVCQVSEADLYLLVPERSRSSWQTKLRALIVSSLGAGLLTLPIAAYFFSEVSVSGLFINLILVPVAGFLQAPAICLAAFGAFLHPGITQLGAYFAGILDAICMTLNMWLGSTELVSSFSIMHACLLTIAAIFLISLVNPVGRRTKVVFVVLLSASVFLPGMFRGGDEMVVSFLPVGQGDAAVIEIPPNKVIVIDGGGNYENTYNPGERVITPFLRRRSIEVIDVVILSHPDADHLMGLLPLFKNFHVKELWHNNFDETHPLMALLLKTARDSGAITRSAKEMSKGFSFASANIEFIAPTKISSHSRELQSTNNRSLVLKISFEGQSVLFPGDIEEAFEQELILDGKDLVATIVKAPHHGSMSSSSPKFIEATAAYHVVFSTGVNNRFGFPHAQVVDRWRETGAVLWDTAVNGETTFRLHDGMAEVEPFIMTSEDRS